MLRISWPSAAVSRNRPSSSACGPASPTMSTSRSASCSAAPVATIAVESEIIPPTSTTVVHEMPRWACSTVSTREHDHRAGGEQARDRRRARRRWRAARPSRPAPRAPAWRPRPAARPAGARAPAGRRPARSGSSRLLVERGPRALQQQRVALGQHGLPGPSVLALALHGEDHEVAAGRDHAREHRVAGQLRARRDHDLGDARAARQQRSACWSSAYCATSVRAWSLKSGAIERGWRSRQQPVAEQRRRSRSLPTTSGTPTSANSKKRTPTPASAAASETITLTGVPVSASSEPACAPKASGSSSCDGERPMPHRQHDRDRHQRRDRAVDVDQRGQQRDQQHRVDDQPRPALPDARRPAPARPTPSRRRRPALR